MTAAVGRVDTIAIGAGCMRTGDEVHDAIQHAKQARADARSRMLLPSNPICTKQLAQIEWVSNTDSMKPTRRNRASQ